MLNLNSINQLELELNPKTNIIFSYFLASHSTVVKLYS